MNLEDPPYNDDRLLLLYVWKINDVPYISMQDLIYNISFNNDILDPSESQEFIEDVILNGYLVKTSRGFELNQELRNELNEWQETGKEAITKMLEKSKRTKAEKVKDIVSKKDGISFIQFFNIFVDERTRNKILESPRKSIDIIIATPNEVRAIVHGTDIYDISIDSINKIIKHDCMDFTNNKAPNNLFCKHLARLFMLLYKYFTSIAIDILDNMAEDLNSWYLEG